MDSAVTYAITVVQLDESVRERWFELVCRTHGETADWQQFATALVAGAVPAGVNTETAELFVLAMATYDVAPLETVGRMCEVAYELPALYQQLAITDAGQEPTGYDESAWNAFLAEHGPYWNGEDAAWPEFRAWFVYEAEQTGVGGPAEAFLTHAENQPDPRAVFTEYGIAVPATAQTEHDWNPFLAEHGPYWNGEDASWEAFRTWFLYEAEQRNLGEPAQAFLTHADSDRRGVFAQYGVTVRYDESAWNTFLAEHGPYWNGEDASWEAFRTWFLYKAEQRNLADPAKAFLAHADSDRRGVLAQYGVTVAQPAPVDVTSHPPLTRGDTGEWVEYLDDMLTRNGF
jgi:hypothetical protein